MKRICIAFLFLLPLLCLTATVTVKAAQVTPPDTEATEEKLREGLLSLLPDMAKEHLGDPADSEAVKEALGFRALLSLVTDTLSSEGTRIGKPLLLLILITVFFGCISLFVKGSTAGTIMQGAAALSYFSLLSGTAERLFGFFSDMKSLTLGLSPLFVALFAGGGETASAASAGAGFSAFLSLLSLFAESVFPPLLRTLLALALLSALGNHTLIRELSRRLSGLAVFFFSLLSMLLLASLAFQSMLSSSADSMTLRTVKYTASSAIPYVGGTLASTLGAMQASFALLRSAAGGTAIVALLVLLLPPLCELLLLRLALSVSESIAIFTEADALASVIGRFRGVLSLALAAAVTVAILFILLIGMLAGHTPAA